jgi:ACT domain-containing protein
MHQPTPTPITMKVNSAVKSSGLSRATLYRLKDSGDIRFLKSGRTNLIDVQSFISYLRSLPDLSSKLEGIRLH